MMEYKTPFQSIRQTQKTTGLPECYLRKLVRAGNAPGVYSGKKFLVNVPALMAQLERESLGVVANG